MPPKRPVIDRFNEKWRLNEDTGCHEWTACRLPKGYGKFGVSPRNIQTAHRVAYTLFIGPIPDGMYVCHRCDNPPCVNPDHLFLGTCQDNSDDKFAKGRELRGTKIKVSRLTEADVIEMRRLYFSRTQDCLSLSRKYNVSPNAVCRAIRGISWRHLLSDEERKRMPIRLSRFYWNSPLETPNKVRK